MNPCGSEVIGHKPLGCLTEYCHKTVWRIEVIVTANNPSASAAGSETRVFEPVQRILLPKRGEPFDVRMLYLIESEQNRERLSLSLIHI